MRSRSPFLLAFALSALVLDAAFVGCGSGDSGDVGGAAGQGGASGSGGAAGASGVGGSAGDGGGAGDGGAGADAGPAIGASVLQHHRDPSRDGVYVDGALTKAAAAGLHRDTSFDATIVGHVYAQPLYVEKGTGGKDAVYVVTESNDVYALDASSGAPLWHKTVASPVALSDLPCGNIDPLGITGTPIIDFASRAIFFDAMTTPDNGATQKHLVFALSLEDGSTLAGWPVDVSATVTSGSTPFDSRYQHQRGALALVGGTLYVPYGGHWGDCGTYHGWVVGFPLANPGAPVAWATDARAGGTWAPSGIASEGARLFVATGNTMGASTWGGGEAIVALGAGATFSGQAADYFAPSNWKQLDNGDVDIGGSGPVLFDVAGATPSKLAAALGKNGVAYLLDRTNLGGIGTGDGTTGEGLYSARVASNELITAAVAYTTASGTYLAFKGSGTACPGGTSGDLVALKMVPGAPPTFTTAWCASQGGEGSPMVTTTDGMADAIVWGLGSEGSQQLRGFDGDTGAVVFAGGSGSDTMTSLRRYITPIAVKGRIFVAGDGKVYAFTP